MDDTIVVLRFNDLGQARHALDELKRLDRKQEEEHCHVIQFRAVIRFQANAADPGCQR